MPREAAALHTAQPPLQAVEQHTPDAQKPEAHSSAPAQAAASWRFGEQLPSEQKKPLEHSAELVHREKHPASAVLQANAPHETGAAVTQTPAPEHTDAGRRAPSPHEATAQRAPASFATSGGHARAAQRSASSQGPATGRHTAPSQAGSAQGHPASRVAPPPVPESPAPPFPPPAPPSAPSRRQRRVAEQT